MVYTLTARIESVNYGRIIVNHDLQRSSKESFVGYFKKLFLNLSRKTDENHRELGIHRPFRNKFTYIHNPLYLYTRKTSLSGVKICVLQSEGPKKIIRS